jgi:hypothetical protein
MEAFEECPMVSFNSHFLPYAFAFMDIGGRIQDAEGSTTSCRGCSYLSNQGSKTGKMQARLQGLIVKILIIRILGQVFYHIEMESRDKAKWL